MEDEFTYSYGEAVCPVNGVIPNRFDTAGHLFHGCPGWGEGSGRGSSYGDGYGLGNGSFQDITQNAGYEEK